MCIRIERLLSCRSLLLLIAFSQARLLIHDILLPTVATEFPELVIHGRVELGQGFHRGIISNTARNIASEVLSVPLQRSSYYVNFCILCLEPTDSYTNNGLAKLKLHSCTVRAYLSK